MMVNWTKRGEDRREPRGERWQALGVGPQRASNWTKRGEDRREPRGERWQALGVGPQRK